MKYAWVNIFFSLFLWKMMDMQVDIEKVYMKGNFDFKIFNITEL